VVQEFISSRPGDSRKGFSWLKVRKVAAAQSKRATSLHCSQGEFQLPLGVYAHANSKC